MNPKLAVLAAALLLAVTSITASAQSPRSDISGSIGFSMMGGIRSLMALIDTNEDGALSIEEIDAANARLFRAVDADGDGLLSQDEAEAFFSE